MYKRQGLEVLLEIHSSEELTYINEKIDMVGINNRTLGTFFTDVENSFRLAGQLPQDAVLVLSLIHIYWEWIRHF